MMNIAVLVSGGGTNLQALIDAQNRGEIKNGRITLVVSSNPDAYAIERAKKNGIKTVVVAKKDYSDRAQYTRAITGVMTENKVDLIVYAGFMIILDSQIVEAFPSKMMNVHPALIPSFCGKGYYGLHVHEAVLDSGVKLTGATVHFVTQDCDAGPIIMQKAIEVENDDTPETLQKRVMKQCEWKILPQAVSLFCEGRIKVNGNKTQII